MQFDKATIDKKKRQPSILGNATKKIVNGEIVRQNSSLPKVMDK
jgi:hypothetical protein